MAGRSRSGSAGHSGEGRKPDIALEAAAEAALRSGKRRKL